MILNVSGRTDIVAFYTEWFMNRLKEGFVDVRNPFNRNLISRIYFKDVDAILFCTKNPHPIIKYLNNINIPFIFHITVTPYKEDIEVNVNKKNIINDIKIISNIIGNENLFIRYDPIFLSPKYTLDYHIKAFTKLCQSLKGYVKYIIVSFIDDYKNVQSNMNVLNYREFGKEDYEKIGINFSLIAKENNMTVQTCFEKENLVEYGFIKGDCINREMANKLTGKSEFKKWKSRKGNNCECVALTDIGDYNTCPHYCKYCYANYNEKTVKNNIKNHDVNSSILIGRISQDDIIKIRKC